MNQQLKNPNNLESIKPNALREEPYLEWKYQYDEETETMKFDSVSLSDGSKPTKENIDRSLEKSAGTSNPKIAQMIIKKASRGFKDNSRKAAFRHGAYTKESLALYKEAMSLIRQSKNLWTTLKEALFLK